MIIFHVKDIDRDKDGFVSLNEFLGDYRDADDTGDEPEWVKEETKRFTDEYDKNHDGKLDKEEVIVTNDRNDKLFFIEDSPLEILLGKEIDKQGLN